MYTYISTYKYNLCMYTNLYMSVHIYIYIYVFEGKARPKKDACRTVRRLLGKEPVLPYLFCGSGVVPASFRGNSASVFQLSGKGREYFLIGSKLNCIQFRVVVCCGWTLFLNWDLPHLSLVKWCGFSACLWVVYFRLYRNCIYIYGPQSLYMDPKWWLCGGRNCACKKREN